MAQLVSLLRTCLTHTKFGALPTKLVAGHSTDGGAAWRRAQSRALAGLPHDGQDHRSIAWHGAIQRALATWMAQAQLQWSDFIRVDMRTVLKQAVTAVYGAQAAKNLSDGMEILAAEAVFQAEGRVKTPPSPLPSLASKNIELRSSNIKRRCRR